MALCAFTALPFGLCSATLICQQTTKSIVYILKSEGISGLTNASMTSTVQNPLVSESSFLCMNSLFDELGVFVSPEKDTLPCHQLLCLGVTINTLDMTLTVPSFRVVELQPELQTWLYKPNVTK